MATVPENVRFRGHNYKAVGGLKSRTDAMAHQTALRKNYLSIVRSNGEGKYQVYCGPDNGYKSKRMGYPSYLATKPKIKKRVG